MCGMRATGRAERLMALRAPEPRFGFEAGAMSQFLFFGLPAAGFDVVCMEARQVNAALSAMRNKTDKTNARGIAQVLQKSIDLANEIRGLFRILRYKASISCGAGLF